MPTDTADHLATMDRAARESGCGVPWQLLAAIARVESDFGRNMATSSAGALGYGQFLPSSWQAFGSDGNVYDYRDALPAIATYLCRFGLASDPRAALFAYNHADWYVDLVLQWAVRYDRMAPGAPIPEVLDTGPAADPGTPLHYAAGRGRSTWLGVPWRGRAAGMPTTRSALETTTLAMLRAAFGLAGEVPPPTASDAVGLSEVANRAWLGGLLPLRGAPQAFRSTGTELWSIEEVRANLARGLPVVALVAAAKLPGHPSVDRLDDQPLLLIGATADGLVYSDPVFSSSLGYGLEIGEPEFVAAWDAASLPRQALAFTRRPRLGGLATHRAEAEPPPVAARQTPTPTPRVDPTPAPLPPVSPEPAPAALEPPPSAADSPLVITAAAPPDVLPRDRIPTAESDDHALPVAVFGLVFAASWLRRWRAGRRASSSSSSA